MRNAIEGKRMHKKRYAVYMSKEKKELLKVKSHSDDEQKQLNVTSYLIKCKQ